MTDIRFSTARPLLLIPMMALSAVATASPALAQEADPPLHGIDAAHDQGDTEIIVSASFVRDLDLLSGKSVVQAEDLTRNMAGQIGDMLTRQPGVSATSFGPGASRPILRGFQGERVRVLTDGIGAGDVSNTSADHGVSIDPLTAERVEILQGPAALLFGSNAIGGAVNIIDRRIPRSVPEAGYHIDAIAGYGSAANERSAGVSADVALGSGIVWHIDGGARKSDDLRTGGYVYDAATRAALTDLALEADAEGEAEEAAEVRAAAGLRGDIPNSAARSRSLGTGLVLIRDGGSLGASFGYYDSRYGVPAAPGTAHHHEDGGEEAPVSIDMVSYRADLRGEVKTGGGLFEAFKWRAGWSDYQHTEYEGDEIGTRFLSQSIEARFELVQKDSGNHRGVIGGQYMVRDFDAIGAEAFVPAYTTQQSGLFTFQEFDFDPFSVELAARYEHTRQSSDRYRSGIGSSEQVAAVSHAYDALSGAIGLAWHADTFTKLTLSLSRTTRAPSAEELFANGVHVATASFVRGNPALSTEKAWGVELSGRALIAGLRLRGSVYASDFDDYIYEANSGLVFDEEGEALVPAAASPGSLPVYDYRQGKARYWGVAAQGEWPFYNDGRVQLTADLLADYTRATLKNGGGPVPQIPPLRVLGGVTADIGAFEARGEVEWVDRQDRVANLEAPTKGYTMANASLTWHPFGRETESALILGVDNIFDVSARRHSSLTRGFVPLAGRNVKATLRVSF